MERYVHALGGLPYLSVEPGCFGWDGKGEKIATQFRGYLYDGNLLIEPHRSLIARIIIYIVLRYYYDCNYDSTT
jgi:hypothetical protein